MLKKLLFIFPLVISTYSFAQDQTEETDVEEVEIDAKALAKKEYEEAVLICSRENKDDCLMCGS